MSIILLSGKIQMCDSRNQNKARMPSGDQVLFSVDLEILTRAVGQQEKGAQIRRNEAVHRWHNC